jgi:hypothetical protein
LSEGTLDAEGEEEGGEAAHVSMHPCTFRKCLSQAVEDTGLLWKKEKVSSAMLALPHSSIRKVILL